MIGVTVAIGVQEEERLSIRCRDLWREKRMGIVSRDESELLL